ncbi:MAG: aspartyl/asparaginyl beta-hydroxylase domain-containing protein [Planctomycetes bacterium]|nr:aspartyl/asparaginyl beta-hydroxylase domain-containing protein [Planctomycetota bacterium]
MQPSAFRDPRAFAFVPALAAAAGEVRAELEALGDEAFAESPDSLGLRPGGYDERGWQWYALCGADAPAAHRAACPRTVRACEAVPGLVNAGFSCFLPGTHLEPHRGELAGVLRCHVPLVVPAGDLGLRFGDEVRRWRAGECLVFDDSLVHDAWNRGAGPRTVLLVTFRP